MAEDYLTIEECPYTKSCNNFKKINNEMIQLVNDHYFDLQMYANYVFSIENGKNILSKQNNFYDKLIDVMKEYGPKYPSIPLFSTNNMEKLNE
jgi:hypothetical protein